MGLPTAGAHSAFLRLAAKCLLLACVGGPWDGIMVEIKEHHKMQVNVPQPCTGTFASLGIRPSIIHLVKPLNYILEI